MLGGQARREPSPPGQPRHRHLLGDRSSSSRRPWSERWGLTFSSLQAMLATSRFRQSVKVPPRRKDPQGVGERAKRARWGGRTYPHSTVSTLHLYLDEAGDFNFSPTGSKYYIFTVAWTTDPSPMARDLARLRFSLLKQGHDIASFHATEDKQVHRNAVVNVLLQHSNWWYAALVVEKSKVNPTLREEHNFYPKFASMVLRFVFKNRRWTTNATRVLTFTDRLPVRKHREAVSAAFKYSCRRDLGKLPFNIYHHPRESNYWLQVVDYCCWAVQRKWARNDVRTYSQLSSRLTTPELDVLFHGNTHYY